MQDLLAVGPKDEQRDGQQPNGPFCYGWFENVIQEFLPVRDQHFAPLWTAVFEICDLPAQI
jgi:hypothetical protein